LLFVGGSDDSAIEMNHQAMTHLAAEHRLETVPGATHLFEEPGALEQVSRSAADWFPRHLAAPKVRSDDR
jgi:alpha-beta hydrolase superfamily lysophospholipase